MASPFEVLGIDSDADEEAVERAYRRRVKEVHPDHGGSVEAFQRVRAARAAALDGDASDGRNDPGVPDWAEVEATEPSPPQVEFLNYEVLDDHGWSLDDDDLFEKAAAADLNGSDYGQFAVDPDEPLLHTAEDCGFTWPYACRGGACANCAVAVTSGDLSMTVDNVLTDEMLGRGIRLSCVGVPTNEDLRVVYNVKHLPDLDDLRLPPGPFGRARGDG